MQKVYGLFIRPHMAQSSYHQKANQKAAANTGHFVQLNC